MSVDSVNKLNIDTLQAHFLPILDPQVQKQSGNLKTYINSKALKQYVPDDVCQTLEQYIRDQIMDIAKKQYLLMEKTDDFGDAGEQRVAISFCRVLLGIPAEREVTQLDANLFREELTTFDEKLGHPSAEKLKREINVPTVSLWGKKLLLSQSEINQLLAFIGSSWRLTFTIAKEGPEYMLGEEVLIPDVHKKFRNKDVMLKKNEVARSPLYILSMAATATPTGTLIRQASCETIFYNKWHSYYETSDFEKELLRSHDYSNIREAIKDQALKVYGYKNQNQVEAGKKLFIDEMVEGIVWHELGHAISLEENKFIPARVASFGAALGSFGNEAITVLKEALADWAPAVDGACGPIWHFIQVSKSDYSKAKRMVYVYLSDYWFLDVGEDFMGITTDVIVPLIVQFMDSKGEIDFKKMEKAHPEIFQYLVKRYVAGITQLEQIVSKARYQINAQNVLTYDVLERQVVDLYLEQPRNQGKTREEIFGTTHFWVNLLGYLKKFSPDGYREFNKTLHDYTQAFCNDLLAKLTQKNTAKFNQIREYVIHQMKQIGCYFSDKEKTPQDWIEEAVTELDLPSEPGKAAVAKFKAVMKGEAKVEVAIDYESKPSPFVAVLQSILVRTEVGDILSGMAMGEDLPAGFKANETNLREWLQQLKKHIDDKDFGAVNLLKVNQNLLENATLFQPVFDAIKLKNGQALKELVKRVSIAPVSDGHLLEVFIPLKKGYWDWNTVQAVWRINSAFRPQKSDLQWTVDKPFLDYLFQEISK